MGDLQAQDVEAVKPPKPSPEPNRRAAGSSDSDESASIDDDDLSESGSEEYCETSRKGSSRRSANKSPMRKRRKRPEWTRSEEETLAQVHCGVGNQWSVIAARLPGRTANEVKNIWHSTLRSKHLKARSLLRAYATALNGRWDDEGARQEAYDAALRQHSVGGEEREPNAPIGGEVTLPIGAVKRGDTALTPRVGTGASLRGDGALLAVTPAHARTSDGNRSPPATLARQRAGRGPPATAPRPLMNDSPAGRGGLHRHHPSGSTKRPSSPSSCPARGPRGREQSLEIRGDATSEVRRNLGGALTTPPGQQEMADETGGDSGKALQDEQQHPPSATAARPLPLSCGGSWGPPPPVLQRSPWLQVQALHADNARGTQQLQQQPPRPLQQPLHMEQEARIEADLPVEIGIKTEFTEGAISTLDDGQQVLGHDSLDTWLGKLDPSIMLNEDEDATRHRGGAGSNSSTVARAPSMSAAAGGDGLGLGTNQLPGSMPGYELPESGPVSGAWSNNSGAAGLHIQSPPPDSGCGSLQQPLVARPDLSTAMAISPLARGGNACAGEMHDSFQPLPGQSQAAAALAGYGHVQAGPYPATGTAACAPLSIGSVAEGQIRSMAATGWAFSGARSSASFAGRSIGMGLPYEGWHGPPPPIMRSGPGMAHGADLRGSMYMVPVNGPPLPPALPLHMIVGAANPHVHQSYPGQQQYELFGRHQRMRQQEHIFGQQQQQRYLQQQQHDEQAQYRQQSGQQQGPQSYRQPGQWQPEQVKQEVQPYQDSAWRQQQQQQQQPPPQQQPVVSQEERQAQQHEQAQQQLLLQQAQYLEQHADSLSSSDIVTMGLDSLQDPQLRWCLMDTE